MIKYMVLFSQCWHDQIGDGVDPVGRLHAVGAANARDAGVAEKSEISVRVIST